MARTLEFKFGKAKYPREIKVSKNAAKVLDPERKDQYLDILVKAVQAIPLAHTHLDQNKVIKKNKFPGDDKMHDALNDAGGLAGGAATKKENETTLKNYVGLIKELSNKSSFLQPSKKFKESTYTSSNGSRCHLAGACETQAVAVYGFLVDSGIPAMLLCWDNLDHATVIAGESLDKKDVREAIMAAIKTKKRSIVGVLDALKAKKCKDVCFLDAWSGTLFHAYNDMNELKELMITLARGGEMKGPLKALEWNEKKRSMTWFNDPLVVYWLYGKDFGYDYNVEMNRKKKK